MFSSNPIQEENIPLADSGDTSATFVRSNYHNLKILSVNSNYSVLKQVIKTTTEQSTLKLRGYYWDS